MKNCYQLPSHISRGKITVVIGDQTYTWGGGCGAILKSYERGLSVGTVRVIGDVPFFVYAVNKRDIFGFSAPEIWWTVPDAVSTSDWVREFRNLLFQ